MSTIEEKRKQHPNAIILQQQGLFFYTYDEDAVILSNIAGYKLNQMENGRYKCGFAANSEKGIKKVIECFDNRQVNFYIYKNEELLHYRSKTENEYERMFQKARATINTDYEENLHDADEFTFILDSKVKKTLTDFVIKHPQYSMQELVNKALLVGLKELNTK